MGLFPNNSSKKQIFAAKLLKGIGGYFTGEIIPEEYCVDQLHIVKCGVAFKESSAITLTIGVKIDCTTYIFTGTTAAVFRILSGLLVKNNKIATDAEVSIAIREALAGSSDINIAGGKFICQYITSDPNSTVFQHHVYGYYLTNGADQIISTGNGINILVPTGA